MQIPEGEYRVGTDDDYYVRTNVWSAPGCHGAACGAILHIKDGKFVDIEGDESNPITQGRLCIKCLNMTEFEYHPERIIYPMKRDPRRIAARTRGSASPGMRRTTSLRRTTTRLSRRRERRMLC